MLSLKRHLFFDLPPFPGRAEMLGFGQRNKWQLHWNGNFSQRTLAHTIVDIQFHNCPDRHLRRMQSVTILGLFSSGHLKLPILQARQESGR